VSLQQLQEALAANNRNDGAGRLASGEESLLVRSDGGIRSLDDVRAIAITSGRHGRARGRRGQVRLARSRATARDPTAAARPCRAWCWACAAPTRQLVREVRATLTRSAPPCPRASDRALLRPRRLVERAVGTVSKALGVLVLVLLLLFPATCAPRWWWR
jgi:cobalt-zinc-cadmium resistance protein CzcA